MRCVTAVRRLRYGAAACRLLRRNEARRGRRYSLGRGGSGPESLFLNDKYLIWQNKDNSRRSIAEDGQSGLVGAVNAILHRDLSSQEAVELKLVDGLFEAVAGDIELSKVPTRRYKM